MATFKYTIASGCDTDLMQKHSHSALISDINNSAKSNISPYAVISSARVVLVMSHNGGLGSADLNVWLCNNESDNSGENLISGSTNKNDDKTYQKDITSKITSKYPFTFNTSYSRLAVYYKSTTHRHYRDRDFYVEYTYSIPNYTVTVNAGNGGTVSGGGTYQAGTTVRLKATPNPGYKFVRWVCSDGSTSTNSEYSFGIGSNFTFTAEFTLATCEVIIEVEEGMNGVVPTVTGAGIYKYGDTVTLTAQMPLYHEFYCWRSWDFPNASYFYENPFTFTIDEGFLTENGNLYDIKIYCSMTFTGYIVKAEVQPENAGIVEAGFYISAINDFIFQEVPDEGILVDDDGNESHFIVKGLLVKAVPNTGYEFVQWSDGETANPREANLTGDATFTAIFRKLPPEFKSVYMVYMDNQISPSHKVLCNESFILAVDVN